MSKKQIKVGHEYLCKIGRNDVRVVVVSAPAMGAITVKSVASQKTVKIADPARLKAVPGGASTATPSESETPTSAKAAKAPGAKKQPAQPKERRLGLMGAALKVLEEAEHADLPMSCKKMVETAMAKRYWAPLKGGKTPVNTLAAMILRDLKNGNDAKFRRAEEHFGRGRFFPNR